jgi:hypothetical protein
MKFSAVVFTCLLVCNFIYPVTVSDYRLFTGIAVSSGGITNIILRKFKLDGRNYYFTVNPETLIAGLSQELPAFVQPLAFLEINKMLEHTPYFDTLDQAEENSVINDDAGITHFLRTQKGIDLTVDLCPSRKPLDRFLFKDIIVEFGKIEKPVPVAVSITGKWMEKHNDDLNWLKGLEKEGLLNITWVNHTYNHRFSKMLPLRRNYILESGTDISYEILQTEVLMLEKGLMPSVFFRFPGLVSDHLVFEQIESFGLIPIGSDAWLGKLQWPRAGSIVLVHGNGNEEVGIKRFFKVLKENQDKITNKSWFLYDLRESLLEEEK